ncbi:MAG: hypothetical protein GY820_20875, partial [Gammaproteobacteria bacterium]|nr:hypothetical protein [Gammaproteobacteria bacterium]
MGESSADVGGRRNGGGGGGEGGVGVTALGNSYLHIRPRTARLKMKVTQEAPEGFNMVGGRAHCALFSSGCCSLAYLPPPPPPPPPPP